MEEMFLVLLIFISTSSLISITSSEAAMLYEFREHLPPTSQNLKSHKTCIGGKNISNDSTLNCHAAKFNRSMGFFKSCSRHSHCYSSREPSDWCLISNNFMWTNAGCHCDKKIGSCLIERYSRNDYQLQWAYCVPKTEFYCATRYYKIKATLT